MRYAALLVLMTAVSCGDGEREKPKAEERVVLFDQDLTLAKGKWTWGEIKGDRKGAWQIHLTVMAGRVGINTMTIKSNEPEDPGSHFSHGSGGIGPYDPAVLKGKKAGLDRKEFRRRRFQLPHQGRVRPQSLIFPGLSEPAPAVIKKSCHAWSIGSTGGLEFQDRDDGA